MSARFASTHAPRHRADSAYSWAVAAATLALASLSFGAVMSIPILFGPIARDFGWHHGRVAMVHTGAMVCAGLFSIVFGRLLDRRGFFPIAVCGALATGTGLVLVSRATSFWEMALAFGLLVGALGQGAFFSPLAAAVSHWFDRHRGIAVAIALSGQSIGGFLVPPLLRVAAEHVGWRSALQAYGLLCSAGMLVAATLYLPAPPPTHVASDPARSPAGGRRGTRITLLLGAVGQLQFEVVADRLAREYGVDALYDNASVTTARWLVFPDSATQRDFEREQAAALATDVDGNAVFLATNKYNLQVTMERWPKVGFHATREHGQRL